MQAKIKNAVKKILNFCKKKEIKPITVYKNSDDVLQGKVALITGGSSGIGFAIAKSFLMAGCKVVIAGSNEERLRTAAKKICLLKENVPLERLAYVKIDVSQIDVMSEKIKLAASKFEENRIDILVNSAGKITKHDFWHIDENEWDDVIDINVKGTFFMSRAMADYMIQKQIKGHILNITSASALRPAWGAYQISKWAVKGMTLGLADILLSKDIVVNALAPGPTATPMLQKKDGEDIYNGSNPSGRFATPEEIANLAVFMVSGAGDYVVGDTFYITGGGGTISLHK